MAYHCWCQGRQMWRSVDNCGDIARTCHGSFCRGDSQSWRQMAPLNSQGEIPQPDGQSDRTRGPSLVHWEGLDDLGDSFRVFLLEAWAGRV